MPTIKSKIVNTIRVAIEEGKLTPRFRVDDVIRACPAFTVGSCKRMLYRHRVGNPDGAKEYFMQNGDGTFSLAPAFNP